MTYGVNNPREQQKLNEFYHYESAQLTALRTVNADLLTALLAQPEDTRGCTCLSMTAYNCPFCLRRAAIARATGRQYEQTL